MKRLTACYALALCMLLCASYGAVAAAEKPMPRTIYTFYDKKLEDIPRLTLIHRTLEMPLNWLGFHLEYYNRKDPLPAWRDDVAGVMLWLPSGIAMPDQSAFADWLEDGLNQRKKLIVMGNTGFDAKWRDTPLGQRRINKIFHRIGLRDTGTWVELTYTSEITKKNREMVEFERAYAGILPSYYSVQAMDGGGATSHLQAADKGDKTNPIVSDLITTHPNGGYIAEGYGFYYEMDATGDEVLAQRWMVNPFRFLSNVLRVDDAPKADVSTLNGLRIFYSHMDGDGWNNVTEVSKYSKEKTIASEVLLKEIYEPYSQLPFTVAPIVAELDPTCYGLKQSKNIAEQMFALPNVEAASHTYSHPLLWRYFEDGNAGKEERYLDKYPKRPSANGSVYEAISGLTGESGEHENAWAKVLAEQRRRTLKAEGRLKDIPEESQLNTLVDANFHTPRSYACEPYDITKEIKGSADYLQALAPAGKKVSLIQWSGDTTPPENVLAEVSKYSMLNINGGDSRFDPEYPSYSYVSPIGLQVGKERQIYSSNSNENTYTNLWSDRFFGFRHLVNTVKNTETPYRVSPFNIYYHSYSGQKQASLEALKQNIGYALSQDIAPIFASNYARIAEGYFSAQFIPLDATRWKIMNRGALQTIRFDHATLKTVDWERSVGVIGMRHYQGSLYMALDPKNPDPIIAVKASNNTAFPIPATKAYVIESRWVIASMRQHEGEVSIDAQGFGRGLLQLYWPYSQKVRMQVLRDGKILLNQLVNAKQDQTLMLAIHTDAVMPVTIELVAEPDM